MMKRNQVGSCGYASIIIVLIQLIILFMLFGSNEEPSKEVEQPICPICPHCPTCPECPHCPQCPTCPICAPVAPTSSSSAPAPDKPAIAYDFVSPAQTSWPINLVKEPTPFWFCTRPQELISKNIVQAHFYAPRETMIFHHILSDPNTGCKSVPGGKWVVDAGAHLGYFSMLSAAMGCRVLSFEPQNHWYPNFMVSKRINGFDDRITLYKGVAVSTPNSKVNVGFDYFNGGVHGLGSAGASLEVDTFRLDEVLKKHGVDNLLILKIDVEGYEMEVLKGNSNYQGSIENYLMEIKLGYNIDVSDEEKKAWIRETMKKNNYNAFQFVEDYYNHARKINWNVYENPHFRFYGQEYNSASEDFWITGDKKMAEIFK